MFQLDLAPADPILGLTETYKADTHPDKINLGVGVYQDATGKTPILKAVTQAEARLLETETGKLSPTDPGVAELATHTQNHYLGQDTQSSRRVAQNRANSRWDRCPARGRRFLIARGASSDRLDLEPKLGESSGDFRSGRAPC